MKKYLLTLATVAAAGTMMAADLTLEVAQATDIKGTFKESTYKEDGGLQESANYKPLEGLTIAGFDFTFGKEDEKASDPALYMTEDGQTAVTLRLYKSNTMTIAFPANQTVGSIVWNFKSIKGLDYVTVSTGEAQVKAKEKMLVWNNAAGATSVTFTFPSEKGSDGNNPNVQITGFTVSSESASVDPIDPTPDPVDGLYTGLVNNCDWTFDNVYLPEGLNYVWKWDDRYNYLKGSAYYKGIFVAESWAVSPVIDLTKAVDPSVNFEHAANYQTTLKDLCGFYVREVNGEWQELAIANWPEAGSWTFVEAGAMSLKAFAGKKIQLAAKYESSEAGADTWEIKNVVIKDSEAGVANIASENGAAVYFDLNGRRVAEPVNGLFIKVQGGKASKVIIK